MSLEESEARGKLGAHSHGVLGTLHPERGVDLTPIVYATDGEFLGSPVDLVKKKSSLRLQRERNLESDPRATLLIEQWDRDDWSRLWWVRAELKWVGEDRGRRAETLAARLAESYVQYRHKPFARMLVFEIVGATGWTASGSSST